MATAFDDRETAVQAQVTTADRVESIVIRRVAGQAYPDVIVNFIRAVGGSARPELRYAKRLTPQQAQAAWNSGALKTFHDQIYLAIDTARANP